jgi:hypothetical protein
MAVKIVVGVVLLLVCGIYMVLTAPLTVEAGHIAVVQSRIFGLSDTVYDPNRINWVWTRLIPGDSKAFAFPEGQSLARRTLTFILPPGSLPGLNNTNDFTCILEFSFNWSFSRECLVTLVASGIKSEDELAARVLDRIEPLLRHALVDETERALTANEVPNLVQASNAVIEREAASRLAAFLSELQVELIRFNAYWSTLPDLGRYARMRVVLQEADLQLSEHIREWRRTGADIDRKVREDEQQYRFLQAMAKLVTDHPKLLDYFAITKLSDKIRLALLPMNMNSAGSSELALSGILQHVHRTLQTNLLVPGQEEPQEAERTAP